MPVPGSKAFTIYERSPVFVQNAMSSFYGLKKLFEERNRAFRRILAEINETQWWTPARLRELQISRLREIVRFAQEHVPFYRKRFADYGVSWQQIQSLDDLRRFPILTKEDVRSNKHELIADVRLPGRTIRQSTSGTTGSPLEVLLSRETFLAEKAWIMRHRSWAGYDGRSWRGTFGGHRVVPIAQENPPFWRYNLPWKQIHFSTFHMSEKNLSHYVQVLRSKPVEFLDGYPSTLYIMARYLISVGQTIPMRAVFTGAEPLYDSYREAIETAFQCKVFDYYGLTEKVVSAGECDKRSGLHVSMEHVVAEIIPVGSAEEKGDGPVGELIGTNLVNRVMPLIRYKTGDLVYSCQGSCPCGRGLEVIGQVKTKVEDIIICPNGRHISASNLTYPFKPVHSIRESQIIQESLDEIVVRIVRGPNYTNADEQRLFEGIRACLGPGMNVRAEYVEEIPRTPTGKFRFVISRVASDLLGRPSG